MYCSDRCKHAAARLRGYAAECGEIPLPPSMTIDDVAQVASDTAICAAAWESASERAPYRLRGKCKRIGDGICDVLRGEGLL